MIRFILAAAILEANGWVIPEYVKIIIWVLIGLKFLCSAIKAIANSPDTER